MRKGDIHKRRESWLAEGDADRKGTSIRKWSSYIIIILVIVGSLYILNLAGKIKGLLNASCEKEKSAVWQHRVTSLGHDEKTGDFLWMESNGDSIRFYDRHQTGVLPIIQPGDSIFKESGTFDISWKRTGAAEAMLLLAGKQDCD